MNMKIVLGILLILGFLTIGTASAYELVDFKAAYPTPDGLAQLKGGTIEWGDWQVWEINDYIDDESTVIEVNDDEYTIFYRALGFSVPKITGVEKVVIDTEPVFPNETVENETIVPETPAQGESYMSPVGLLKLKSGSIESGEYEVWNASDYKYIFTHNLELEGVNYAIKCALCDPDGGKIVAVDPMTPTDPPAKFRMGSNQTIVENQTVYGHDPVVSENKTPGKIYMSPVGPLKLKSGSIESGDFEVWDIDDYNYIFTGTLVLNGTIYDVVFALVGEGGKICTVSKVAVDEPQFIGDNVEHKNITFQSTKKGKPVSTQDESDDDTVVVVVPKNAKRVVVQSGGDDSSAESQSVNVENESGSDVEVDANNSSKDNNDKKADDKQDGGIMGILQNCKGLISVIFAVLAIIGAGYKRF